jgi:seryl-tRNA synthetase
VPEPLRKYLPGAPEFISFTKELPKDSTSQRAKAKAEKSGKAPKAVAGTAAEVAEKLKNLST